MPDPHHDDANQGPLRLLPNPPDVATRRVLKKKLSGHATSATLLVEGLSDELDALRAEHLGIRDRVAAEGRTVAALEERHRAEDAEYQERRRQAARDDDPGSVEDRRTPAGERESERAKALDRYWSAVHVLGERVDAVRAYFRHAEPELLAELRRRRGPAEEKRREAQRLLDEAKRAEWGLAELGRWVQQTTDGTLGAQPAPVPSAPPPTFSGHMLDRALERPSYATPEAVEQPVAWLDQEPERAPVEPVGTEDETGQVSELVEHQGATS